MRTSSFDDRVAVVPRRRRRPVRLLVEALEERRVLSTGTAGVPVTASAAAPGTATARGDWTVMVYMTADDLARFAPGNIEAMERLALHLPSTVKIVVLYDQYTNRNAAGERNDDPMVPDPSYYPTGNGTQDAWSTEGIGVIQGDAHEGELDANDDQVAGVAPRIATTFDVSRSEVNTGDPSTLADFVAIAAAVAPARHYALIMWDHGGGVQGLNSDHYDVLRDDSLASTRLVAALQEDRAAGINLDLLAYDECQMATLEGAYELGDLAPVTVASEENIDGPGYDYDTALGILANDPADVTADDLARSLVSSFNGKYGGQGDWADTLSAVTRKGVAGVASALHDFVIATQAAGPADWAAIDQARAEAPFFGGNQHQPKVQNSYHDLGLFMNDLAIGPASPGIRIAAQAVEAAVASTVFARTADGRGNRGESIFFPAAGTAANPNYVAEAGSFLAATGWGGFLDRYRAALASRPAAQPPGWAYNHNGVASALDLGTQVGVNPAVPGLVLPAGGQDWYRFATLAPGGRRNSVSVAGGQAGRVMLRVYEAGTSTLVAQGRGMVSLRGLPAGQYVMSATRVHPGSAVAYSLNVAAPNAAVAIPAANTTAATAASLGPIVTTQLYAGLRRATAAQPAWFSFDTPRSAVPLRGRATILSPGVPLTATLYDEQGDALKTVRGRQALQLDYVDSGSAQSYRIAVRGRATSYSIFFAELRDAN